MNRGRKVLNGCIRIGHDDGRTFYWIPIRNILKIKSEAVDVSEEGLRLYLVKATLINGEIVVVEDKIEYDDVEWLLNKVGKGSDE